jgi:hypothetical protein
VIDDDSRAALESSDPRSVRLILPRDSEDGRNRYEVAADCLAEWRHDGALAVDDRAFYLYEMLFQDEDARYRRTHGVIGALGLPPPGPIHRGGRPSARADHDDGEDRPAVAPCARR